MNKQWTKEDLRVYTLIYAANADKETPLEYSFIKTKIKDSDFNALHEEFDQDNDFQRISKIMDAIEVLDYDTPDALLNEILELFKADENYSAIEQGVFSVLRRIIN